MRGMGIGSKIILCIFGILVLTQILFYNVLQSRNVKEANLEQLRLAAEIQRLSGRKTEMQQNLSDLQKEYKQVAASIPAEILTGYEDPEVMLANFLDYIQSPAYKKVEAQVAMDGIQRFIEAPVPVFENNINFTFSFTQLKDAESFLNLVLGQDYYPLVIRNIEMRNDGRRKVKATLKSALLIPAKQKAPFFKTRDDS